MDESPKLPAIHAIIPAVLRSLALTFAFGVGSILALDPGGAPPEDEPPPCCKTCHKGKACGDSCIARSKSCDKPKGCACDAEPED